MTYETAAPQRYIPAAGRGSLTRLYDPMMTLTMREDAWRPRLIDELLAGDGVADVLDLGCGTGTIALEIARRAPQVAVTGVDGDPEILSIAASKAAVAGLDVELVAALATGLPFAESSFDRIACSLLLHHLVPVQKAAALAECRRVLRPGGRLVVADWGRGPDPLMRAVFFGLRALDGFEPTAAHAAGELPGVIAAAGFTEPRRRGRWRTVWGTLELLLAERY